MQCESRHLESRVSTVAYVYSTFYDFFDKLPFIFYIFLSVLFMRTFARSHERQSDVSRVRNVSVPVENLSVRKFRLSNLFAICFFFFTEHIDLRHWASCLYRRNENNTTTCAVPRPTREQTRCVFAIIFPFNFIESTIRIGGNRGSSCRYRYICCLDLFKSKWCVFEKRFMSGVVDAVHTAYRCTYIHTELYERHVLC